MCCSQQSLNDLDIRHGDARFGVFLVLFGLSLVQYFLTSMFLNGNVYLMMLEACDMLFDFNFVDEITGK